MLSLSKEAYRELYEELVPILYHTTLSGWPVWVRPETSTSQRLAQSFRAGEMPQAPRMSRA